MPFFDPYTREHADDPYPRYRQLRDEAPLSYNPHLNFWALARHADVVAAFRDTKRFISSEGITIERTGKGMPYLITRDPPHHSWHKALVTKVFSAARMAGMEAFIRARARELLEPLADRAEFDLVHEFSVRLPLDVISELIDIPADYRDEIHRLAAQALQRGEGTDMAEVAATYERRMAIYRELIAARRKQPRDDAITLLLQQEVTDEDGQTRRLSDAEIAYHFSELASAGHETVSMAIPSALAALEQFPDQRAWLAADLGRIPNAVEEFLRWDPPSQYQVRTAACDLTLLDQPIAKGEMVVLLNASAVRDERAVDEPDRLDLSRPPSSQSLYFGFGVHKCLGVHLARLELRVALEELFALFPGYRVESARGRRDIVTSIRGLSALPFLPRG